VTAEPCARAPSGKQCAKLWSSCVPSTLVFPEEQRTSSVPGAVLFDDFDLVQNTAIGTITGGILNMGSAACVCASGGNFIGTGGGQDAITVTFTNPVSYAGFT